uniref:non-specific serine/threonine protein kinase n=1 Tax=Ditylenchus dipsaci TaxID=166011 RepID=A0A915E074_9BILA
MATSEKKLLNSVIGGKYRLHQKVGSGSFGEIYLALHTYTNQTYAVKVEAINTPHPQLVYENKVYRHLNFLEYSIGIPQVHHFGLEKGEYYCLVMDLLGLSLEDLFNFCGRQFTIRTVVMLADQLLTRIKQLHESDFLHRDVKPDNFLMGMQPSQANTVFIIDYGLAKKYRDSHQKHIAEKNRKQLIGTARYASLNSHLGLEQSRRDDLESLGYMLIYFLKGSLPWQGIKIVSKNEKYAKIYEKKSAVSVEELCQECPHQFADYLNYTRNLGFEETPNYSYLSGLFRDLFLSLPEQAENDFDWTIYARTTPKIQ